MHRQVEDIRKNKKTKSTRIKECKMEMTNKSGVTVQIKTVKSYLIRFLPMSMKLHLSHLLPDLAGLLLAASGSITLAWVGWLTWYDMTTWDKNIALIFFGSRTGENISLGIGMKVIHYFLIGLPLLLSGLITVLRTRSKVIKLHCSRLLRAQQRKEKEKKNKKEDPRVKPPEKEGKGSSGCPHHFGYLATHLKNTPIPQECLTCQKLLECIAVETD